jgi:hypothetical protein
MLEIGHGHDLIAHEHVAGTGRLAEFEGLACLATPDPNDHLVVAIRHQGRWNGRSTRDERGGVITRPLRRDRRPQR